MKIKLLTVLTLLLLFLIPGCGDDSGVTVNTNTAPTIQTPSPVGASTVQGTVYGTDGQPVGTGTTVRLTPNIASVTGSENYGEQQTTTTDAQGGFSFTVHYTGAYLIDALNGTQLIGSQLFNITGAGQVINIILGRPAGRLTVNVVPANAEASVTITPGEGIATSSSPVTGSQTGEYIFYLPAGSYIVYAEATGYEPVAHQSATITEGGEQALTFDFTVEGEIPVSSSMGIDPYVCINTGEISGRYFVEEFTGTGTIEFINRNTGEVVRTVTVDESSLNSITAPPTYYHPEGGTYHYVTFTVDTTGMPTGYYDVKLTHNPPVIGGSSTTTAEQEFYVSDTIQGAASIASNANTYYVAVPQEIVTPEGSSFGWYVKAYIPAGNYRQGVSSAFPAGSNIECGDSVYFQGAGPDNTIIDFNTNPYSINASTWSGGVVVEGFTIKKSTSYGIFCNSYLYYIYNNRIESNGYGIFASSYEHYVFNNIITGNTHHGILFIGTTEGGISIENNVISKNGGGIYIDALSTEGNSFIRGNNIYENTAGFAVQGAGICISSYIGSGLCEITGNVISENSSNTAVGGGIYFNTGAPSGPVNIQNNEITKNTATSSAGGGIYYCGYTNSARIIGNNIYGNTSDTGTGNQLYVFSPATPLLNADNNWWGAGVTINDTEVYQVNTSVDIGTPATTQFPVPDVPAI